MLSLYTEKRLVTRDFLFLHSKLQLLSLLFRSRAMRFVQSPVPRSRSLSSLGDAAVLADGKTASFRLDQKEQQKEERQKGGGAEEEAAIVERMNREYHNEVEKARTVNVTYNRGPKPRKRPTPKKKTNSPPKDDRDGTSGLRSSQDLLTTFQTYSDTYTSNQLPPPPTLQRSPAKYRRLSQEKPATVKEEKPTGTPLVLSPNLTRALLSPQQSTKGASVVGGRLSIEDSGTVRSSCLQDCCAIKRPYYKEEHSTPESLRHLGLPKSPNKTPSPTLHRGGCLPRRRSLHIVPKLSTLLRALTIVFSVLASTARLATNFASDQSLSLWLESPILQLVRLNLAVLQNVFVTIELDFGIPVLLPRKTLDSFLYRGFLVQAVGMIDLLLNRPSQLEDLRDEGGFWATTASIATAAINVASRGLICCGFLYMFLAALGHNANHRRKKEVVGLQKTPKRKE